MSRYRAVLLDAYGTLIRLDDPVGRLRRSAAARLGADVSRTQAVAAIRAEIEHYAANCQSARDRASLDALRRDCAAVVMGQLGLAAGSEPSLAVLSDAIALRAYPDAAAALAMLRRRGLATAVVSNGDCSLADALEQNGLSVDVVVDSATAGAAKPDPRIFQAALARLALAPSQALHVGDSEDTDGDGARAAGIDVVIIDRGSRPQPGTIASLDDLEARLA
ncbi:MAG: putative hydrolase of the superfamily [Gaiellales bacterium]|nr:putative hydrolase of the superfamily [Gaiellales bacterium]